MVRTKREGVVTKRPTIGAPLVPMELECRQWRNPINVPLEVLQLIVHFMSPSLSNVECNEKLSRTSACWLTSLGSSCAAMYWVVQSHPVWRLVVAGLGDSPNALARSLEDLRTSSYCDPVWTSSWRRLAFLQLGKGFWPNRKDEEASSLRFRVGENDPSRTRVWPLEKLSASSYPSRFVSLEELGPLPFNDAEASVLQLSHFVGESGGVALVCAFAPLFAGQSSLMQAHVKHGLTWMAPVVEHHTTNAEDSGLVNCPKISVDLFHYVFNFERGLWEPLAVSYSFFDKDHFFYHNQRCCQLRQLLAFGKRDLPCEGLSFFDLPLYRIWTSDKRLEQSLCFRYDYFSALPGSDCVHGEAD